MVQSAALLDLRVGLGHLRCTHRRAIPVVARDVAKRGVGLMSEHVITPPRPAELSVLGSRQRFPVRRIFCIARNYASHAREMGMAVERAAPVHFMKPGESLASDGAEIAFPPCTDLLHHEVELVIALAAGGSHVPVARALDLVFGYAVGNDLTRRDVQARMREKGHPWEAAKVFDGAAPTGAIAPATRIGHPRRGRIRLTVDGEVRQEGDIADMIWSPAEIISHLSRWQRLLAGDLIFTGTPAGVGPLHPGNRVTGEIEGVGTLTHTMAPPEDAGARS